jgi:hypothetical protein
MENQKLKKGDINSTGLIYWDSGPKGERWLSPEKFEQWSKKKAERMRHYNQKDSSKCAVKEAKLKFRKNNPEAQSKYDKKYKLKNKLRLDEYKKVWRLRNPEKVKAAVARSRSTKEKRRAIHQKTISNPLAKMRILIRSRSSKAIKRNRWKKDFSTIKHLGCSWSFAKSHIESQFKEGMSWGNHGFKGWHIDHIVPLSSAKTIDELLPLVHYSNLQPLWASENLKKWAKIL